MVHTTPNVSQPSKRRILLVEDEASIADTVVFALEREGFEVIWKTLATEALTEADLQFFDFFILDVGLADMSGFELCKQLRLKHQSPILFLTARSEEIDRVVGLEIGGDDYMTKPFSPRELVARVKVILKRMQPLAQSLVQGEGGDSTSVAEPQACSVPGFTVEPEKARITYQTTPLTLTRYEYRMMLIFLENPQRVYSREQLLQMVWEDPDQSFDRAVDTHIKTLRAKLKAVAPNCESPIKTHRGLGYSLSV